MFFNRKCKITYICNGATIFTEDDRFTDAENYPPLSESGVEEVEKICEFLKKRGVKNDKIYTSPATRTVQTAQMIAKIYKQDYDVIEDLHPRKCGKFSGMTFEQLEEKCPEELDRLINQPDIRTPDDAESITEFINRVKVTIDRIVEENQGSRIIIVTYKDVIKAAICQALHIPNSSLQRIYIKTGSATQISYYEKWSSLVYSDYTPFS